MARSQEIQTVAKSDLRFPSAFLFHNPNDETIFI